MFVAGEGLGLRVGLILGPDRDPLKARDTADLRA
jgi:hypothetical protein